MVLKIVVEIGYLVIIKVIVGGGGRGMCFVQEEKDFFKLFYVVQGEVGVVFGNLGVYLEKFIEKFCYIEF